MRQRARLLLKAGSFCPKVRYSNILANHMKPVITAGEKTFVLEHFNPTIMKNRHNMVRSIYIILFCAKKPYKDTNFFVFL